MTKTSKVTGKVTAALAAFGLAVALGAAPSCGGVSGSDVVAARNRATTASCNYYKMCGQIGSGGTFESDSTCQTMVLSYWTGQWTDAACLGKVDQSGLNVCVDAINSTLCMNGLDVLATLLAKCPVARVCPGSTDAGGGN
jgi:hypothetical protein